MVCCHSFIVEQIYDVLRAACGLLIFLPLDMFSDRPDVKPARVPTYGSLLDTTKGGACLLYIMIYVYIFKCHFYAFEKCTRSTDGCTKERFIVIQDAEIMKLVHT